MPLGPISERYTPAPMPCNWAIVPRKSFAFSREAYEVRSKNTSPKPYSPSTTVGVTPKSSEGNSPVNLGSSWVATKPPWPPPACMGMPSGCTSPQAMSAP